MKKILIALLAMIYLSGISFGICAAEAVYQFSVDDIVIGYTEEGTTTVSVKNNAGFAGFILNLTYDTDFLVLQSAEKSNGDNESYNAGNLIVNVDTPGTIRAVFASPVNVSGDLDLLDIVFRADAVPEDKGVTLVTLQVEFLDDEIWSDDTLTRQAASKDGRVTVRTLTGLRIDNCGVESYIENQELDVSKILVTALYNDGTERLLDPEEYEIFDYSTPLLVGETPKIKYTENTVEITQNTEITVRKKSLTGIRADFSAMKTQYREGEFLQVEGLLVFSQFDNGEEELLDASLYTLEKTDVPLMMEDTVITVTYMLDGVSYTARIPIQVLSSRLVSIRLENIPQKKIYKTYETFSTEELKVIGCYEGGREAELTEYTLEGFDASVGDKTVYIVASGIRSEGIFVTVVVPGDVTGNGLIQPNDATALLQHLVRLTVLNEVQQAAADVYGNCNGLDPNDAIAILKYCAGYQIELK